MHSQIFCDFYGQFPDRFRNLKILSLFVNFGKEFSFKILANFLFLEDFVLEISDNLIEQIEGTGSNFLDQNICLQNLSINGEFLRDDCL
jgi:hypothetical protein